MQFQFLFRHCKMPKKMDFNLEPWMLELLKNIEVEDKEKLEETYGVEFHPDSLHLSCLFVTSFCDDFKEAGNHDKERLLKDHIVKILDAACQRVTCNLHNVVVEEDGYDLEYLLHRACTELVEVGKEKEYPSSELWMHHVRKEFESLMDTWHNCEKKWKPLILSNSERRAEELGMLNQVHDELVSYLQEKEAITELEVLTRLFQKLNGLRAKIELSINKELKEILTVRESDLVEAARRILGIPALLSSKNFKLNYVDLETRLAKRVFGQEHAIHAITSVLSEPHSGKGPIGSFIFICSSESGGEELIKALAEQLFYDEERVIEFNLEKYENVDSTMHPNVFELSEQIGLSKDKKCGFRGELFSALKKMPSAVILLHNIDEAHVSVIDFLLEILRNGKVEDEKGKLVDFAKTLIIMTSNVSGSSEFRRRWNCNCAFLQGKLFLKEKMEDHDCPYMSLLKAAKQHFKPQLLDIIDNMIVFKQLSNLEFRAIVRIRIRKLANFIGGGRIIVYPSEAALYFIAPQTESYNECLKPYLELIVVPKLLDICDQSRSGRSTVYIDTLVGTDELSYRVEMDGYLTGDQEFGQFLAYLSEFWNMYKRELLWLRNINGLRKTLHQFIDRAKISGDPLLLEHLAYKIRKLVTSENVVDLNFKIGFSTFANAGRSKRRDKEMGDLLIKLQTRFVANHYVFNVVVNAVLSCTEVAANDSHPMTAILLGLTADGKANLRRDLTELVNDESNGISDMFVQINLSQCSDYDEFFRLICSGHKHHGSVCPGRVGMKLGSVILIDQVEKAPKSVFSGLISLLDNRILTHHNGACTIDLSDVVIIMVSDLGNKDFIVEIFEKSSRYWWPTPALGSVSKNAKKGPERSRFRSELMNRVNEVVFFNPCAGVDDQMTSFARLSMIDGPHLRSRTPPGALNVVFLQLFDGSDIKRDTLSMVCLIETVRSISKGFLTND